MQLYRSNKLIINLPPRHLKSLCTSIAFPTWVLGHDPSTKIMCVSYSEDLANTLSSDCLKIIENEWYKELFPHIKLHQRHKSKSEFQTTKNDKRISASIAGSVTGMGGDYLIIDDPIKPNEALSLDSPQIEKVNTWYSSA